LDFSILECRHWSADVNEICFSMMAVLVENGANVNYQNDIGKTA